jgi:hypothetical protein
MLTLSTSTQYLFREWNNMVCARNSIITRYLYSGDALHGRLLTRGTKVAAAHKSLGPGV